MAINSDQALSKLMKYCSLQERCHSEVIEKLVRLECPSQYHQSIIAKLIELNFLNEKRFCKSFVRGKFLIKKWGNQKIASALKQKGLSEEHIKEGFEEIELEQYNQTIVKLYKRKEISLRNKAKYTDFEINLKIISYLNQKGYTYYEIKCAIDELENLN